MGNFPHATLEPIDVTPRIQPETAGKVLDLVDSLRELQGEKTPYKTSPAIIVAVFSGSLVKYLVDEQQCEETIGNLERAIEKITAPVVQ